MDDRNNREDPFTVVHTSSVPNRRPVCQSVTARIGSHPVHSTPLNTAWTCIFSLVRLFLYVGHILYFTRLPPASSLDHPCPLRPKLPGTHFPPVVAADPFCFVDEKIIAIEVFGRVSPSDSILLLFPRIFSFIFFVFFHCPSCPRGY